MPSNNKFELKTDNNEVYLVVSYHEEEQMLYLDWDWKEDYGIDCIKEGCWLALELLEKYQLEGAVSDLIKVDGNWYDASVWIVDEWLPKAQKVGIKRWIFIRSEDYFSDLSANHLVEGLDLNGFLTHNVRTLEEAKKLLDFPMN